MKVDIYDFDKTLVPFDSGSLFIGYCFLHYPWIIIYTPVLVVSALLWVTKIISFTKFKKICFMFVPLIPLDKAVKGFWDKHEHQVFPWFKERTRTAVVISASPDFLLGEIQKRLDLKYLICTRHNRKTGAIIGENCRDDEKVIRFRKEFPQAEVQDVYSDSYTHDRPIFSLAKGNCYHIENGERVLFDYNKQYSSK